MIAPKETCKKCGRKVEYPLDDGVCHTCYWVTPYPAEDLPEDGIVEKRIYIPNPRRQGVIRRIK